VLAQDLAVDLIVAACAAYAAWRLMPSAARRRIAVLALRLPLPALLASPLRHAARGANACGCDGCDAAGAKPAAGAAQRVTFHPRRHR